MRLLFLAHRIPFPPNKGDKIRSFHILRFLSERHDVFLASMVDDMADLRFVSEVQSRVRGFVFARIRPLPKKALALAAVLQSRPISVPYFYSPELQRRIDELIESGRIEAFFCYSSPMAEYLFRSRHTDGRIAAATRIMDLIDIDSYKWRQYAANSASWKSWIFRYEAKHLARYEKRIADGFDRVLVVSEQERLHFPGTPRDNVHAMSNGVDLDYFNPSHARALATPGPTLVFTGVMDYWPNVEGMKWFVEQVFPGVRAALSEVRLYVVGSRPTSEVQRLANQQGVIVTGFVEDVRDYLAAATVCVVPLRIARGIQNKVLEAMAMGKAVVTTPQALEGIRAEPGRDLVVAETEEVFAAAVSELLKDPCKAQEIGRNARSCVERRYSWEANLALLDQILPPSPASARLRASA